MQQKQTQISTTNLYYKEFGSKNSEVFLILHGWGGKSDSWVEVSKLLEKKGYRIIIPDLPGFGKTNLDKVYTLDDYSELIYNFIIKLKLKNITLLGHSNGGAISINMINLSRNDAELHGSADGLLKENPIKKLILNNSAGIRNDKRRNFKRKLLNILIKPFKILKNIKGFSKLRNFFYRAIGNHDYINSEKVPFLKETYKNIIASDLKDIIPKIKTETLLVWGEKDTYTPLSDGKYMSKNIKDSKLIVLENQTHGIHLKNPKLLVDTILKNL